MCLQIGSKVAVLDEAISGVVFKIDEKGVHVKANDGMHYIYLASDLVKIDVDQNELLNSSINNSFFFKDKEERKPKKTAFKKTKNEVVMEVDLHAGKLVKSTRGMDNFDILNLQLNTARRKLEYCIEKKISKIVFIHGVGEGVLKSELQYLFNKYPVKYYDASYSKYGLGATEVYVFQNANNVNF